MNNSRASHYRYLLLHSPLLILLFGLWIQLSALYDREHQIHNIAMQMAGSSSTTHTAIAENTVINITDKDKQTQDTDTISRDTEHASYTMTQINTEVLDIRKGLSEDLSKDGFKAVGDLAMREGWEDGSVEKTLAHAAMGAVVAAVGNGDALGGALGAGAAEAARPATANANDATQQSVSALVGAIAGGGTGASVGLDGEKYNRQLHQREIELIRNNADAFAKQKGISPEEALKLLSSAALAGVDSYYAGLQVDPDAKAFLQNLAEHNGGVAFVDDKGRNQHMFNETDRSLYNNHAVNANTLFTEGAREVYNAGGKELDFIKRGGIKGGEVVDNIVSAIGKGDLDNLLKEGDEAFRSFVKNTETLSQSKDLTKEEQENLHNVAIQNMVDGRREGIIKVDEIYGDGEFAQLQDRNIKNLGLASAIVSVGAIKSNGNVILRLKNGKTVEVPKEAVGRDSAGRIILKGNKIPKFHQENFLDGKYINRQANGNEIFYRYHSVNNKTGKTHTYVTNKKYDSEEALRNDAAILKEWGEITHVTTIKPQKGTWVSEGKVAPQTGKSGEFREGGGYQGLIDTKNIPKSTIIKTETLPKEF